MVLGRITCQFNKKFNAPIEKEREQCLARLVVHYLPVSANLLSAFSSPPSRAIRSSLLFSRWYCIFICLTVAQASSPPPRSRSPSFGDCCPRCSQCLPPTIVWAELVQSSAVTCRLVFTAVVPLCAPSRT